MPRMNKSSNTAAKISERWKQLLPSERAMYFQRAAEDKFRYYSEKREYDDYLATLPKDVAKPAQAKRKKATKAKRAKSASSLDENDSLMEPLQFETAAVPNSLFHLHSCTPQVVNVPVTLVLPPKNDVPHYSRESIAFLASKLDDSSINFLINALK